MNSLTLFEIDQRYIDITNRIEAAGGELTPELEFEYDMLLVDIVNKEVGYIAIDQHLNSQIESGKALIARIKDRVASIERHQSILKERLKQHMITTGKDVIETDLGKIRLQSTQSVKDLPVTEYPAQFQKSEIVVKADKAGLKKAAKDNPELEKFIETNYHIRIY